MLEVARANAQRSGAILRMTANEFDSATAFGPSSIIHGSSHKTSASFGSARIVVSAESNRLMKAFDTVRNLAVENADSQASFFCTVAGKRLHACQMTNAFTEAYRRDGIVVRDHNGKPCRITATRLRKAHVACARGADRLDQNMFDMARHMQHWLRTQQAYYDAADRDRISVVVHDRIMEDSFRRARPVATCSSVPVVPVESHRPPPNHAENSVADAQATNSADGEAPDAVNAVNAREEAAAASEAEAAAVTTKSRRAGFTEADVAFLRSPAVVCVAPAGEKSYFCEIPYQKNGKVPSASPTVRSIPRRSESDSAAFAGVDTSDGTPVRSFGRAPATAIRFRPIENLMIQ